MVINNTHISITDELQKVEAGLDVEVTELSSQLSKSLEKIPCDKILRDARIYILSDNQTALKSYTYGSNLTWDCKQCLRQLVERKRVTLLWVPGHKRVKGNKEVDIQYSFTWSSNDIHRSLPTEVPIQ